MIMRTSLKDTLSGVLAATALAAAAAGGGVPLAALTRIGQ